MKIEVILTPAELPALKQRDLGDTACVVFDVLRATSSFVTALHHGAKAVVPVSEISEALAWRQKQPAVLLGGERDGVSIRAAQTGGVDFDLGNSPREYTPEKVRGKTIVGEKIFSDRIFFKDIMRPILAVLGTSRQEIQALGKTVPDLAIP